MNIDGLRNALGRIGEIERQITSLGKDALVGRPAFPQLDRDTVTLANPRHAAVTTVGAAIRTASEKERIPEELVRAVIKVESDNQVFARSPKGALGLMQLMPETARSLGVKNPFDPAQNIAGGTAFLRKLLDQFDGDLTLALAAYNAGPQTVLDAGRRVPPYAETRAYVQRVLEVYRGFRGLNGAAATEADHG